MSVTEENQNFFCDSEFATNFGLRYFSLFPKTYGFLYANVGPATINYE